jgi:predicted MFS family arabinose efflux permease
MAVACGLAVANIYYAQPLLALIADSFHISHGAATAVVTANQIGYALGLILMLPLGDLVNNRKLTSRTLIGTALALGIAAASPNVGLFLAMSVLIGVASVVAQILIPLAAHLASGEARGRAVGQVMSGLLLGILLARTVASLAAAAWGWRSIYVISAVLMVATSVALARVLPDRQPDHQATYRRLMVSVVQVARAEPVLRYHAASQALLFATFSAFWTAITYELIGVHHLGQAAVGVFALVGAAGAATAPLAGRLGDRGHGATGRIVFILVGVAAMVLANLGAGSVVLLAAAGALLDLAVQGHQVLSQRDVYSLRADARARINTVFMTSVFLGGAVASVAVGWLDDHYGWSGVTVFATCLPAAAAILWLVGRYRLSSRLGQS